MAAASAAGNLHALVAANRAFHFTLYEASGLPRLVAMIRQVWDATEPYRAHYYSEGRFRERAIAEHREIIRAAGARNAKRVVRLLAEHRDHASTALAEILARPDRDSDAAATFFPAQAEPQHPRSG
jgi:DNA-binding GntR family transcriptional regulator